MSTYTTGELAKLCGVTVRTVQFYDGKDLLKPSGLSEGGRRLYSEQDLKKLRLICLLKALGLSLDSIKGLLASGNQQKVLLLLLDEQEKKASAEIEERRRQLAVIEAVKETVRGSETIPAGSILDIEHMMNDQKKLKRTHGVMLVIGILMDLIEIAALAVWLATGIWWPFATGMALVILMGILVTRMYYLKTAYLCPECGVKFRPRLRAFLFSRHTPRTRELTCTACGYSGFCVETAADEPERRVRT